MLLNFFNLFKLAFFSYPSSKTIIKKILYLLIVLSILTSFCLLLPIRNENILTVYKNSNYDFILQGINKKQYTTISQMDFVDNAYPFSIVSSTICSNGQTSDITLLVVENLEGIEFSTFSSATLIKSSNDYSNQTNQIFIDYKLAKDFDLQLGSIVELPFGSEMKLLPFTVSKIYEPHQMYGKYDAMILWAGEHRKLYEKEFDTEIGYSHLFLKINNKDKFEDYINNYFVPQGLLKTPEDQYNFDRSEIDLLCESRVNRLAEETRMLQYTPPIVAITSFLGGVVFFLFIFREQNQKFDLYFKKFCVFNVIGCSFKKISFMFFLETIIFQIPITVCSLLVVKYFIYSFLSGTNYLSNELLIKTLVIEVIGMILIASIYSIHSYIKLKNSNIFEILSKE